MVAAISFAPLTLITHNGHSIRISCEIIGESLCVHVLAAAGVGGLHVLLLVLFAPLHQDAFLRRRKDEVGCLAMCESSALLALPVRQTRPNVLLQAGKGLL